MAFLIPVVTGHSLVGLLELLIFPVLSEFPLKVSQIRNRSAESEGVVEHFQEHIYNSILVGFAIGFALCVDVEDDDVRRCIGRQLHIRKHHRIGDFLIIYEIINGPLAADYFIVQNVGEDLQQVRFTTSEEAGNPHAHLGSLAIDALCVCREEICKMTLQLRRYYVLFKLCGYIGFLTLSGNNDALDITGDRLFEHFLDLHIHTSLHKFECAIVIIVFNFVEKNQLLLGICSGEEQYHRCFQHRLMQVVQYLM